MIFPESLDRVRTQKQVCSRYGAGFLACSSDDRIGIALSTLGRVPINGVRYRPGNGTCGWYVWAGEDLPDDPDFFSPLHVAHLGVRLPSVIPFLGLPPGYRFLLAPNHEDVWRDPQACLG